MYADVAQLVAHHLAKVRVASSSLVIRSVGLRWSPPRTPTPGGVAEWLRQGPAKPCTRVRFPSPPRTISSAGEHYLDTVGVTGSIPVSSIGIKGRKLTSFRPFLFLGSPR